MKTRLGRKAYGSIPHLPGSRLGPADHTCHDGQYRICCEKARDKHDTIIVQEKLDGGCVSAARIDGEIIALGRAGYLASTSPFEQHHLFAEWVDRNAERFRAMLQDGERAVGEWLAQAHGTRYTLLHEPFVLFDIMRAADRESVKKVVARSLLPGFTTPEILHIGPVSVHDALELLGMFGHHGALDEAEGCVWRVERKGRVDFLAKYVRPGKVDGRYLSGGDLVWNWRPTT